MSDANFLDVKIMGREYRIACAPEERPALEAAVALVDQKMRDIAQKTKSTIAERVAVMAALNIAHERLAAGAGEPAAPVVDTSDTKRRIEAMGARLDAVLVPQQQLEL